MAFIGLKHLTVAVGAYTDGAVPTYTNSATLGKLIEANLTIDRASAKLYADDALAESDNSVTGGTLTVRIDDLDLDEECKVLGLVKSTTGDVYSLTDADAPYVGVGYVRKKSVNGVKSYIGYWLYKVQFGITDDSASTRGEATDFATQSLEGAVMGIDVDGTGKQVFYIRKSFSTESAAIAWVNANGVSA